jgi:hypothetical protein
METCYAIGEWEGAFLHCHLPSGHKTLLEHFDRDRGLRWLQGDGCKDAAWPGTEADTRAFVALVDRSLGLSQDAGGADG